MVRTNRSRAYNRSRSRSPVRGKRYDDPRDRRSPAPSGLLVRNISLSARPEDLRVPFERFGPVKDIYLPKNYYTGEPRGFGFVKFRNPEDAADAKSYLDRAVIGGREVRIVFAEENRKTPQEMRRMTRIRSPSRSPGRRHLSHSRSSSPSKHGTRGYVARGGRYSPHRSRSFSNSVSPRAGENNRSRAEFPRNANPYSRSPQPHDEKTKEPKFRSASPEGNVEAALVRRPYKKDS